MFTSVTKGRICMVKGMLFLVVKEVPSGRLSDG